MRYGVIHRLIIFAVIVAMPLGASLPAVAAIGDVPPETAGTVLRGFDPLLVKNIQKRLRELGIYVGPADGRMADETAAAIRTYQKLARLNVDGKVSRALLTRLDTAVVKSGRLLSRVESARLEQTDAARKALEDHAAARDLLAAIPAQSPSATTPVGGEAACLATPEPDCLLNEALKAALATGKTHLRNGAFRDVALAWTMVGDVTAGIATAKRMSDPRMLIVALGKIARVQADDGDFEGAHTTALAVPDPRVRAQALAALATVQLDVNLEGDARYTLSEVLDATARITTPLWRTTLICRVATLRARLGEAEIANTMLDQALEGARKIKGRLARDNALARVASALAEVGRLDEALYTTASIGQARHRVPVLILITKIFADAGKITNARIIANTIGDARYRVTALISVALAQASGGDVGGARQTLSDARVASREIDREYSRAYALSRVARSQAEIGTIEDARETAQEVDREKLYALALWAIAASPASLCEQAVSCEDETLAFAATRKIKNELARITLLTDIAVTRAQAGDRKAAISLFDEALAVAQDLVKPWARARALSRLATTLSAIR